jgi:hypothetical protein
MKVRIGGVVYNCPQLQLDAALAAQAAGLLFIEPYSTRSERKITPAEAVSGKLKLTGRPSRRDLAVLPKDSFLIQSFATGHGWTFGGTGNALAQVATGGKVTADHVGITLNNTTFSTLKKTGLVGTGPVVGASGVDMTNRHIGFYVKVTNLTSLNAMSFMYGPASGLSGGNYYAWSNQVWSSSQVPGVSGYLEEGKWKWVTLGFAERGLTGTVTDPGGANPPSAIQDWQFAMTGNANAATAPAVVEISGLFVRNNGI